MQITKKQLFDIECALQLAEYFCDEREGGSDREQNKRDWETLNKAMKVIKQVLEVDHA